MTSGVDGPTWQARYPDLTGKVAVVSGDHRAVPAVVAALSANGAAIAVVTPNRGTVDAATSAAESHGVAVFGVVAQPDDRRTWVRVSAHAEQRLGPLDILVTFGPEGARAVVIDALLPDMVARQRGVIVEVGEPSASSDEASYGVRRRLVTGDELSIDDVAAATALCSSDVLAVPLAEIRLRAV